MTSLMGIKKGEKVTLLGFTGIVLSQMEVVAATKTTLTLLKKDGTELMFNKKDGTQINVVEGKEKYANKVVHVNDTPVQAKKEKKEPVAKKEVSKGTKKKVTKEVVVETDEDDFDDDDEYEDA